MSRYAIPPAPKQDLQALVEKRMSCRAIADTYGIDPKTAKRWLDGYGLKTNNHKGRPYAITDDATLAVVRVWTKQGLSAGSVARRVNVDTRTVKRSLMRAASIDAAVMPVERTRPSAYALECAWAFGIASGQAVYPPCYFTEQGDKDREALR